MICSAPFTGLLGVVGLSHEPSIPDAALKRLTSRSPVNGAESIAGATVNPA
jgi:hypothetical protein